MDTNNNTDIEVCPFCGSPAKLRTGNFRYDYCYHYAVGCVVKGCRGYHYPDKNDPSTPEEAVQRWNKRQWPTPPTAAAVLRDAFGNWYDVLGNRIVEEQKGK